jgi:hypothetical protein
MIRPPGGRGARGLVTTYLDDRPRLIMARLPIAFAGRAAGGGGLTARLSSASRRRPIATLSTNRTEEAIPAPRGLIYDRAGRVLVTNVPTFAVKLRPADLPQAQRPQVVERLAALLDMDVAEVNAAIDSNPGSNFDLVRIADADERTALLISRRGPLTCPGLRRRRGSPPVHGRPVASQISGTLVLCPRAAPRSPAHRHPRRSVGQDGPGAQTRPARASTAPSVGETRPGGGHRSSRRSAGKPGRY